MNEPGATGEPAASQCPWCSAALDDPAVPTCPSCGAALQEQADRDLPGVTQIDALALATQRRERGKGMRGLIGLTDEETQGSPARAIPGPPSEEVRKEMLRLRLTALEAELEARAAALAAAKAAEATGAGGPPADATTVPEAPPPADTSS